MAIKLIALDTDGTLLNSEGKILTSTKEVLKKALDQGIKIVLCSGRPVAGLKGYMDELGIRGSAQYVITLNGAIIRNADDDIIAEDLVSNDFYRKMTAFGMEYKIPFNIVDSHSRIITADHNVDPMIYQQAYENQAVLYIRTPDSIPEDNISIAKGCFVGDPALLDEYEPKIRKEFGKDLYVVRADPHFLELLNADVNKGNGLKTLCTKLGFNSDEVMAFGDERNDISMFKVAGTAVAMGNANDDAKQAADYVTASNDEDGIKQAVDKFVFNN